ncbi:YbaB/EbfC family nucleoid-associated protein [Actinoplanes sp. NPDC026623]|uniref:YbaB/EbfC family nucleoid-associated protein n=1 Tax=Actinoplanes sp. NPDC026623 TaxID=3155610 RepID=UPI0033F4A242
MPLDPDDMLRSFEMRVESQTRRALQLSAELEAAEVTVRSAGGELTVSVNSAGGLADLEFHPEADSLSREELAQLVLVTSRRAQAKLADRVGELVSSMYGSDSSTAAFVADAYASRYPAPVDGEEEGR